MQLDDLGAADNMTLTVGRLPDGKFSIKSGTSQIDTVILANQVAELRIRGGQIHVLRKIRLDDALDRAAAAGGLQDAP